MGFYDQTSYPTWSAPARTPPFESRPSMIPSLFSRLDGLTFSCAGADLSFLDLPKLDEPSAFNHQLEGTSYIPSILFLFDFILFLDLTILAGWRG